MELPRTINLGSGKSYDPEQFNIDVNPQWAPDALIDLSRHGALQDSYDCGRFGTMALPQGYFERINAFDVLEHVRELTTMMDHCLALLADGGRMYIQVPYDLSLGAWQDPTHVRAFNQMSWSYFTDLYWYLGWKQSRFDMESLLYIVSPMGARLQAEGMPDEEVITRARAVDAMHVTLRKRALHAAEIEYSTQHSRRVK
jgi:SAM-dependent methyltransferase